jgi:tetratricopeptide (TPR) repeat protein
VAARAIVTQELDPALSVAIDLALSRVLLGSSYPAAVAACERGLAGARLLGEKRAIARGVFYLGEAYIFADRLDEAEAALAEARDLSREIGDQYREVSALQLLGRVYIERKQFEIAREHIATSMRFYEKRGAERNRGVALLNQASLERATGDIPRAIELAGEANKMAKQLSDRTLEVLALSSAATCLIIEERFDEAKANIRVALTLSHDDRILNGFESVILSCVAFAVRDQDYERAGRLFGFAKKSKADGLPGNAFMGVDTDELLSRLRSHIADERLEALIADGAGWSEERGYEEAFSAC